MTRRRYTPQEGVTMFQGVQIPYTVMWIKGKPDPKVIDPAKVRKCLSLGLCGVCGLRLDRLAGVAFVGGMGGLIDKGDQTLYGDPPNHPECAEQALKECPFLVGKNGAGVYGIRRALWYEWNPESLMSWPKPEGKETRRMMASDVGARSWPARRR